MKVTNIQIFLCMDVNGKICFEANFTVDNRWLIQLGDDGEFFIPAASEVYGWDEAAQDSASKKNVAAVVEELGLPTALADVWSIADERYGDEEAISFCEEKFPED